MRRLVFVITACTTSPAREPQPQRPPPIAAVVTPAVTDEERAFAVLADDHATPEAWQDAAAALVFAPDLDHPKAVRGEPLRGRSSPSVTDLIVRRVATPGLDLDVACGLADALLRWDPPAGKPVAAQQMTRAIHATDGRDHAIIATLAVDRADAGDLVALDDYAGWIVTLAPSESGLDHDSFVPMALFPDRPSIAKASEQMFRDGSSWVPIMSPVPRKVEHMAPDYLLAPSNLGKVGGFIAVSGLNQHVVKALADKRVVGKLTVHDGLNLEWVDGGSSSVPTGDPAPPDGTTRTVRVCDYYAWQLSAHPGAPAFELTWTDARRDQAFAPMITWVKRQLNQRSPRPLGG